MLHLIAVLLATRSSGGGGRTIVHTAIGDLSCEDVGERSRQCLGVPFAAPPVGELRWRSPAKPLMWQGVRDASSAAKRPICIQGNTQPQPGIQQEDCLYLDIYAPRTPPAPGAKPYPVMIWIHGGSYENGSPQNATAIVDLAGDVVWVGVNYRLGWAGFLGAEALRSRSGGSTGNYGIQDQRFAMEWTQQHIASFGGDPAQVTIDGCSAGAGSVAIHITNNRSWPFFHRAGGQSGVISQWNSLPLAAAETFYDLFANAANCTLVGCMASKSPASLATAATDAWTARTNQPDFDGSNNYAPVVDGAELMDTPLQLTVRGETFRGPVLLGTAADEICSLEGRDFPFAMSETDFKADTAEEYGHDGVNVSAVVAMYGGRPNASCGCGSPQMPSYCIPCKRKKPYSPWWWAAIERGSDFGFHCPSAKFAALFGAANPTYLYSYRVLKEQFPGLYCVPHCSEQGGIFFAPSSLDPATPEGQLLLATVHYRISFVRHGDPNVDKLPSAPEWPPYRPSRAEGDGGGAVLAFAVEGSGQSSAAGRKEKIFVERGYRSEQCQYWETLTGHPDHRQAGGVVKQPAL